MLAYGSLNAYDIKHFKITKNHKIKTVRDKQILHSKITIHLSLYGNARREQEEEIV